MWIQDSQRYTHLLAFSWYGHIINEEGIINTPYVHFRSIGRFPLLDTRGLDPSIGPLLDDWLKGGNSAGAGNHLVQR